MPPKRSLTGSTVLTYWNIEEFIGSGGYGNVYKAYRMIGKDKTYAAIKHIIIPEDEQYRERLFSLRNDKNATDKYFKGLHEDIMEEIRTMDKLTGKSVNVVAYRNHEVIEHANPTRFEIFIEMEFLKPFNKHCTETSLTTDEVLKMGKDIASGLEACHLKNIMHRDIKETNIFIDSDGNYKLGDFGLAKALSESSKARSDAGTMAYKAPEVVMPFAEYRKTVDIYSLGIVMYRLFNNGRIPFLPPYPEEYGYEDENIAMAKRFKGEILPNPQSAPRSVTEVILKACAPKPEDRYQTAAELRLALELAKSKLSSEELETIVSTPIENEEYEVESTRGKNYGSFGKTIDRELDYEHENIYESSDEKRVKRASVSSNINDKQLEPVIKRHRKWPLATTAAILLIFTVVIILSKLLAGEEKEALNQKDNMMLGSVNSSTMLSSTDNQGMTKQENIGSESNTTVNSIQQTTQEVEKIMSDKAASDKAVDKVVDKVVADKAATDKAAADKAAADKAAADKAAADKAAADKAAVDKAAADKAAADKAVADKAAADKASADKAAADNTMKSENNDAVKIIPNDALIIKGIVPEDFLIKFNRDKLSADLKDFAHISVCGIDQNTQDTIDRFVKTAQQGDGLVTYDDKKGFRETNQAKYNIVIIHDKKTKAVGYYIIES